MPITNETRELFERIYAVDLVYEPNCWKLCGDAHCCSFSRHKSKFKFMAQDKFQELPLLPGEWQYLKEKGWVDQFGDHELKVGEYQVGNLSFRLESVVSRRPHCACNHATRTTVCRLYPLLPVFDIDGKLLGVERVGIYEELEALDRSEPACQLSALNFQQMNLYMQICNEIASHPVLLFYVMSYVRAKRHVTDRIRTLKNQKSAVSAFSLFESAYLRRQLIDHRALDLDLGQLADRFSDMYGERFATDWSRLHADEPRRVAELVNA